MPFALLLFLATAQPVCAAVALPPAMPLTAGVAYTQMPALTLGERADVTLAETARVTYLTLPDKSALPGTRGGLLKFTADQAGTYRVALGTGAWIDMIDPAAKPIASTAHGHGPACSGIRKMIDFKLAPGNYALQLSGSRDASTGVTVTRVP